jgi:hypothetical protein
MPTIPTGDLEKELRKLYLRWLAGVPRHQADMPSYIKEFEVSSRLLIARMGGQVASLGALADFPVPKVLELSPVAGVVYNDMQQAAIKAGIATGLNATDTARQILNAGLGQSFNKLNRLARTETVSAYWKNSWDSIADLPLIVMIWGSEDSKRTCEYCRSRDGLVIEDGSIRDHPNGRCTPVPTLRSRVKYKGTLQPDGSVTMDPRWADQKVKGAKAMDSAGPSTAEQRNPLSGKSNPAAPSKALPAQKNNPVPASVAPIDNDRLNAAASRARAAEFQNEAFGRGQYDTMFYEGASRKAVDKYVLDDDWALRQNAAFRAGKKPGGVTVKNLDSAIAENSLVEDIELWRGMALTEKQVAAFTVGSDVSMVGWTSTTTSRKIADFYAKERAMDIGSGVSDYSLRMIPKAGTKAASAGAEIIVERGTTWRILSRKDNVLTLVQV